MNGSNMVQPMPVVKRYWSLVELRVARCVLRGERQTNR
jgi:hypothetical protein